MRWWIMTMSASNTGAVEAMVFRGADMISDTGIRALRPSAITFRRKSLSVTIPTMTPAASRTKMLLQRRRLIMSAALWTGRSPLHDTSERVHTS